MGARNIIFRAPVGDAKDITPPSCALSTTATDPATAAVVVTATFSEPVTGFDADTDLTVTHGAAGTPVDSGDHTVYTVSIIPTSADPLDMTVKVNAGVCTDYAGNANTASNTLTFMRLYSYLAALSGTLELKYNETSGNIINYGSDGGAGTNTATQGQTGQLGTSEAYLFDGVNDRITFTATALPGTAALTSQRGFALVKANTIGEGSQGRFIQWSSPATTYLRFSSPNALRIGVGTDGTGALALANDNQVSDIMGVWALVFWDYDDANLLGLGRKIRLFTSLASKAPTLLTLATNTAATGTVTAGTTALYIGNRLSEDYTFDGSMDLLWMGAGLWSPAGTPNDRTIMNNISLLCGFT